LLVLNSIIRSRHIFLLQSPAAPRALHSFPTRRSSDLYRLEDGGQHLAAKQNLSGSTIPSIPNQVGGAHRDQGHGRQAGPLGLPHAALRDEIRGPRSSLLRASTPRVTDQAPQGQSRKARIPSHPNTGGGLTRRSFWRVLSSRKLIFPRKNSLPAPQVSHMLLTTPPRLLPPAASCACPKLPGRRSRRRPRAPSSSDRLCESI